MHKAITKHFKKYHIFGFTGTPIFALNAGTGKNPELRTTQQAFGDKLHTYTIVNAILFTNNYREARRVSGVKQSIGSAYLGSVRTMLTSGVVLVLVTAILGIGCTGIVGQICLVISQGCGIALLLVMFILPALLAVLDKLIMGKKPAAPANKGEEVTTYHI